MILSRVLELRVTLPEPRAAVDGNTPQAVQR